MAEGILSELMMIIENDPPPTEEVTHRLNGLAEVICNEGPETRNLLLDLGAYICVCRAWLFCCYGGTQNTSAQAATPAVKSCRDAVLRALFALTPGHTDIMDDVGWQIIAQALDKGCPERTQILGVKLLRNVFIKNEANREHFSFTLGLTTHLLSLIFKPKLTSEFLCEWCYALKALTLNDDVEVAYNKSADRKRDIAQAKVLPSLVGRLNDREYESDTGTLNAIVILLTALAVGDDICEQIEMGNVIAGMRSIYKNHPTDVTLVRNTTSLVRHLCSSRTLREKVSTFALMKWVVDAINKYLKNREMVEEGMACLAYMTVRNSCHVAQFIAKNGLPMTMQIMTDYKDKISILKSSCVVLRNVAENGGLHGKEKLKELGFGLLLNQMKATFIELKEFYILPILKEIESLDRHSFDTASVHHHHHHHHHHGKDVDAISPSSIFENVHLEPKTGRKSLVLDASDDED